MTEARDDAKHPTRHRTAPTTKNLFGLKMSIVLRLRNAESHVTEPTLTFTNEDPG